MDVIFDCPGCEQELAVDAEASGSEIECPSCSEVIVIPAPEDAKSTTGSAPVATHQKLEEGEDTGHSGAMASSAAAKEIVHFQVPQHQEPTEKLVKNTSKPLDVAAKESDKTIRVKTIRHTDCMEVGHDNYDNVVTEFLQLVGKDNIISITPINYTHIDMASKQLMTEYGVSIIYNG
jgi:ribosomal protein S27E